MGGNRFLRFAKADEWAGPDALYTKSLGRLYDTTTSLHTVTNFRAS